MSMPDIKSPKNYPSGTYLCLCLLCDAAYYGPKRSHICAECTSKEDEDGESTAPPMQES